jgi:hypothetical protein
MAKLSDSTYDRILFGNQMGARALAQTSIEDDPEEAARSLQLSGMTGVPADVINPDVDNFEKLQRQILSASIVGSDPDLQDYVLSNPMHRKISSDDWGKMAEASEGYRRYRASTERSWPSLIAGGVGRGMAEGGAGALDAIGFLTGSDSLRNLARKVGQLGPDMTETEQRTIAAQIGAALGGLIDVIPAALLGGVPGAAIQMGLVGGSEQLREAEAAGKPEAAGGAFTGGFATGAVAGALPLHLLGKAGGIAAKAAIGAGAFTGAGEAQEAVKQFIASELYNPRAHYEPNAERLIAEAIVGGALGSVGAFFRHGEKPPLGADPVTDKALKAHADENAKEFKELLRALQSTATAQRSPEALENFIRQHPGRIGITTDALGLLYGPDEVPRPGDGKLGDVPGVAEGFPTGKEIWVDRADLIRRTKPELLEEIGDDLIHSEDGISKNEGKDLPSGQLELPLDASPVAQVLAMVKQAAGLHEAGAAVSGLPPTTEEMVFASLTRPQQKLLKAVEAQNEADIRFESKKAEDAIRKRQTKEWTEKAKAMAPEVRDAVNQRSDVKLTEFLEQGRIDGRKVERAPRLNSASLTEEQQTALEGLHSIHGKYDPDGLAAIFHYPSGEAMVRDLAEVMQLRRQHGVGRDKWISDLVTNEIEARLEKEFGPLEGNIVMEARQHVVAPTMLDMLYAEAENLGTKHGIAPEEAHASIKARAAEASLKATMENQSSKGFLKQAGKEGRLVEQALIDGKPLEAMQAKLRQIYQMERANRAVKVEAAKDKFERNMETQAKREWNAAAQPFRNFIHDIMFKIGRAPDRTLEDLRTSIAAGDQKNLEEFTKMVNEHGSMPVWDRLFQDKPFGDKPNIDKMTTEEFMRLHNSVETMIHNGREITRIWDGINKIDIAEAREGAIEALEGIKAKVVQYQTDATGRTKQWWQAMHAGLITVESFVKRIEKSGGVLTRLMDFASGQAGSERAMRRQYRQMWQAVKIDKPDAPIDNRLLKGVGGRDFLPMNRRNLIVMIVR